jgi:hypothetical protein
MFGRRKEAEAAGATLAAQAQFKELLHTLVLFWEPSGDLSSAERRGFEQAVRALESCLARCLRLEERHLFAAIGDLPGDERLEWPGRCAAVEQGRRHRTEWHRELVDVADRWLPR